MEGAPRCARQAPEGDREAQGIQRHGSGHQGASGGRHWHVDDRSRQWNSAAGEAGTGRVAIIGQPYCPPPSERLDTIVPPVLANLAWYTNPSTDAAIEEGLATINPLKRAAAYGKAQAQVWKDVPWIFQGVDCWSGRMNPPCSFVE
jgi:ABC-type transport system substrate-binding protein